MVEETGVPGKNHRPALHLLLLWIYGWSISDFHKCIALGMHHFELVAYVNFYYNFSVICIWCDIFSFLLLFLLVCWVVSYMYINGLLKIPLHLGCHLFDKTKLYILLLSFSYSSKKYFACCKLVHEFHSHPFLIVVSYGVMYQRLWRSPGWQRCPFVILHHMISWNHLW